jgi:hypothetical protein
VKGVSQRQLTRVLGTGALAFGLLGVVSPGRLARMMDADEAHARSVGFRDLGNALALFTSGDPRPAILQRMLYDVGDALHLLGRKPAAAAAALGFAALGALALVAD